MMLMIATFLMPTVTVMICISTQAGEFDSISKACCNSRDTVACALVWRGNYVFFVNLNL